MGKVRSTFWEKRQASGCLSSRQRVWKGPRGKAERLHPQGCVCGGSLDRQKEREVNVLVFYKSFGGNYVLFMFTFECIWIFIIDIFQRCKHGRQSWGNMHLRTTSQGLTWLAEGVKSIPVLKSSLKLAFTGTKPEWNVKLLDHDYEVPGFKRKIEYKRITGPPKWCGEIHIQKTEGRVRDDAQENGLIHCVSHVTGYSCSIPLLWWPNLQLHPFIVPGAQLRAVILRAAFITSADLQGYFRSSLTAWLSAPVDEMGQHDCIVCVTRGASHLETWLAPHSCLNSKGLWCCWH